jgi:hypothetical protein
MVMNGTFGIPPDAFAQEGVEGELWWVGAGNGPIFLTLVGGYGIGDWVIDGEALISGFLQGGDVTIDIEGQSIFGGAGEMEGNLSRPLGFTIDDLVPLVEEDALNDINLTGEVWGETTVTVDAEGFARSQTVNFSDPAEVTFYYHTVSCTQIQGSWLQDAEATLAEANMAPELDGVWSVVNEDAIIGEASADLEAEIADLLKESLAFNEQFDNCQPVDQDEFTYWVLDIYSLLRSIKKDLSCGLTENKTRWLYPVSYAACTALGAYMEGAVRGCTDRNVPTDLGMMIYATIGLGCFPEGYFTENEGILKRWENRLLERISDLDLSTPEGMGELLQIADAADALNFEGVQAAVQEALKNFVGSGGE